MNAHATWLAATVLAGTLLVGCGSGAPGAAPHGVVRGTFLVEGGPPPGLRFPGGQVTFIPHDPRSASRYVEVSSTGRFSIALDAGTWMLVGRVKGDRTTGTARIAPCQRDSVRVTAGRVTEANFGCEFP